MPAEDLLLRMRVEGSRVVAQEVGTAEREVDKYERTTKRAHHSTEGLTGALHGLRSAAGFALSVGGLAGIGFGLAEAVRKAEEFQNVTAQLRASLRTNVKAPVDAATESMIRFSEHLAVHGGFAPPQDIQGLTMLVRVTHNVRKAQEDLTLATNIARGSHRDLETAVRAVTMVEGGRLGQLTRLGIVLPKHTTALQALTILQQRYAGATTAYNRTAEGAFSNLTNTLDILGEKIGKLLIPYIQKAVGWLSDFVDQAIAGKGAGGQFKDVLVAVWKDGIQPAIRFIGSLIGRVKDLINGFKQGKIWAVAIIGALAGLAGLAGALAVMTAATWAWEAALAAVAVIMSPAGAIVLGVVAIGAAIAVLSRKFPSLWGGLKHGLVDAVNWIIDRLNDVIGAYNSVITSLPFGLGKDLTIGRIEHVNLGRTPAPPPGFGKPGSARTFNQDKTLTNRIIAATPHPAHVGGDVVIHTHVNLDGQQLGRGLTRVGKQALALH